jgi:hypothetical protein
MPGEEGEGSEAQGVEVDRRVVLSSAAYKKIFVGRSIIEFKVRWT